MTTASTRKLGKSNPIKETAFLDLYIGLLQGLRRTANARIGLALSGDYFKEQALNQERSGNSGLPSGFDREAFDYVVTASLLVYCVSMFDVFLSDVTRMLLLNDIAALGKDCMVPIEVLASRNARNEIIKKKVGLRVRDIAYRSFQDRIGSLASIFGIRLDLDQKDVEDLKRLSDLRNKLVHDQSLHYFNLDRKHRPSIRTRKNISRPVTVTARDVRAATKLFMKLGRLTVQIVERKLFGHTNLS